MTGASRSARRYFLVAAAVVAFAAVLGGVTLHLTLAHRAVSPAAIATVADRMSHDADRVEFTDPQRALRLRIAAAKVQPTPRRRLDLAAALLTPRPLAVAATSMEALDSLAISPDGRTMIVEGIQSQLWDIRDRTRPVRLGALEAAHGQAAFTPDGAALVTTSNNQAELWSVADPRHPVRTSTFAPGVGAFSAVSLSADGARALIGTGQSAELWDISQRPAPRRIAALPAGDTVVATRLSADGRIAAVGEWGNNSDAITVWDLTDPIAPQRLSQIPLNGYVAEIALSADHRLLYAGDEDRIGVWSLADLRNPTDVGTLGELTGQASSVALAPDGHSVVTTGYRSAILWDVSRPGRPVYVASLFDNTDGVAAARFTPDGRTVVTAGYDGKARLWDVAALRAYRTGDLRPVPAGGTLIDPATAGDDLTTLAVDDTATLAVATSPTGPTTIWDTSSPRAVTVRATLPGTSRLAALSGNGRVLVAGVGDAVAVWDLSQPTAPREVATLPGTGKVVAAALSADGRLCLTGTDLGSAILWNIDNHAVPVQLATLPDNSDTVMTLAFSPDGRTVLVGGTDDAVTYWDISTRSRPHQIGTLPGHTGGAYAAALGADGHSALTADGHGNVLDWSLPSASTPRPRGTLHGDQDRVQAVGLTAADQVAVISGSTEPGALWLITDPARPAWLTTLPDPRLPTAPTAWSRDAGQAITLSRGTPVLVVWDLDRIRDTLTDPTPRACALGGGGLTAADWRTYSPVPYSDTCPRHSIPPATGGTPLTGSWFVHGAELEVIDGHSGRLRWNEGPCRPDVDQQESMCTGQASIAFTVDGDGLAGVIATVEYLDEQGHPISGYALPPGGFHVGQKFHLDRVDLDVLRVSSDNPQDAFNGYLCGALATDQWHQQCNA